MNDHSQIISSLLNKRQHGTFLFRVSVASLTLFEHDSNNKAETTYVYICLKAYYKTREKRITKEVLHRKKDLVSRYLFVSQLQKTYLPVALFDVQYAVPHYLFICIARYLFHKRENKEKVSIKV
jgi:hypothetical protein